MEHGHVESWSKTREILKNYGIFDELKEIVDSIDGVGLFLRYISDNMNGAGDSQPIECCAAMLSTISRRLDDAANGRGMGEKFN